MDEIAITDIGNYIVDLHFEDPIKDAPTMGKEIKNVAGVVEHGLFCIMTTAVITAGKMELVSRKHKQNINAIFWNVYRTETLSVFGW